MIQTLNNIKIESIDNFNEKLQKLKAGLEECECRIDTHNESRTIVSRDIQNIETQLNKIGTKNNNCPVCLRPILEHDLDIIEQEKQLLQTKINLLQKDVKVSIEKINTLKQKFTMDLLFYFFSSLTLLSGVMVIQARNPVHSVLFLILVFF